MNPQKKEHIHSFLRAFLPALTNAHQYTISHQLTITSIETAYTQLLEAIGRDMTLPIVMIEDRVVINEEPLEDSIYNSRFIQFFKKRGIQHIRINHGITQEELKSFVLMLTAGPVMSEATQNLPHIQFGKVGLGFKRDEGEQKGTHEAVERGADEAEERGTDGGEKSADNAEEEWKTAQIRRYFNNIQEKELGLLENVYSAIKRNQNLPDREIRDAVTEIITAIKQESSVLITFSPLRILDEYTFTHSTNVCILTLAQAMALKIKEDLLHDIGVAAMLHDIGKIFVPEEVLNKRGKLTDAEFELIKLHPEKGAEYLINKPGIPPLAIIVAYEHHMLYNHSGYPEVSSNWRQNICSQMTTIADFFDALRTKRVYRDSLETKIITDQITSMAGNSLNPVLVKNFLFLLKRLFEAQQSQAEN
jgi:HD-GYP domain-containing protein (c-di-GMP phosphodiesterase class II)